MPQMSNLDWFFLMNYFLILFFFCIILIYFMIMLNLFNNVKKIKKSMFYLKWY